jgi:dTDP-4-dehydrorhamnose reductase
MIFDMMHAIGTYGQLKKDKGGYVSKPKVAIVGCTGMLGAITLDSFVQSDKFDVIAVHRNGKEAKNFLAKYPGLETRVLDAETSNIDDIKKAIQGADWVVNAVGIIKPYIHDDDAVESERAVRVNSLFPYNLAKAAGKSKVIQIATDCVYSGQKGAYVESDLHDALDVYGKSKSLGEVWLDNIYHVRCSIIGPELKAHKSLLDWFLGNDKNAELNGFTNHQWNGVTTLHFARIAQGIILENIVVKHSQHVVPGNSISKLDLLKSFAREFDRPDITINATEAPVVVDRTLATENDKLNKTIWAAAGYKTPPTIEKMVKELAEYDFIGKVS